MLMIVLKLYRISWVVAMIPSHQNTSPTSLSDAERDKIEGEITLGEIKYSILKKMKCRRLHSELVKEVDKLVKEVDNTKHYQ